MADEKLNTGPAENISPEAAEPIATPEQVAASEPRQEQTGPTISPGYDGVPDRIVLFPGGRIAFVEVKAPGKTLRPLQVRRKRQLELLGFKVYVLDDPGQIEEILQETGGDAK